MSTENTSVQPDSTDFQPSDLANKSTEDRIAHLENNLLKETVFSGGEMPKIISSGMLEEMTDKRHAILLATRLLSELDDVNMNRVARAAGVSRSYVMYTLSMHLKRGNLPVECKYAARQCVPKKTLDDLTEKQSRIVELSTCPFLSDNEIADNSECATPYVDYVRTVYWDLIEEVGTSIVDQIPTTSNDQATA